MKVVLFCGGLGTRLREHTETTPKPMVNIGDRPILWHLMEYYAHFGHCEFILCLGHMGDQVKKYFIDYVKSKPGDFELCDASIELRVFHKDGTEWKVTFADTGVNANIGERLGAVRPYLEGEESFLANYSDGLSNLPLDDYLEYFYQQDKIACFVSVRPKHSFHTVALGSNNLVENLVPANESEFWVNGGFFAFKKEIFDYLGKGEDLVEEPFQRLIEEQQLLAYPHEDFWACMDTYKDKKAFDDMEARGDMPWQLWQK